jgi:hydroxyacylglutathione hydrolase
MDCERIPLEDDWHDVLNKALRGRGFTAASLAGKAGLSPEKVEDLLDGRFDEKGAAALGTLLGLHVPSLLALGNHHPGHVVLPRGMTMFTSHWGGMAVHSYLAWDPATAEAVAFDTGADAEEMLDFLHDCGLQLRLLLLTHGHGDHVLEADRLAERTGAGVWIGEGEALPGFATFAAGKEFRIGSLIITTRPTRGHSPDGITYVITGLDARVAVVGDALFAGSIGNPNISYDDCLRNAREQILTLPPETILCPGHGPLTTVAMECAHNPFFAGK